MSAYSGSTQSAEKHILHKGAETMCLLFTLLFYNCSDGIHQAEDVTSCQLVDSNTLKFRNGVVYELVGMPDHFTSKYNSSTNYSLQPVSPNEITIVILFVCVISDLPYYIRNKFQCGFPSDWKTVKELWIKYIKEGN